MSDAFFINAHNSEPMSQSQCHVDNILSLLIGKCLNQIIVLEVYGLIKVENIRVIKTRRNCDITFDITAPIYWWITTDVSKFIPYDIEIVSKIREREFEINDFSHEYLDTFSVDGELYQDFGDDLEYTIDQLNYMRAYWLVTGDNKWLYKIKQALPTSYNITLKDVYTTRAAQSAIFKELNNPEREKMHPYSVDDLNTYKRCVKDLLDECEHR